MFKKYATGSAIVYNYFYWYLTSMVGTLEILSDIFACQVQLGSFTLISLLYDEVLLDTNRLSSSYMLHGYDRLIQFCFDVYAPLYIELHKISTRFPHVCLT